LGAPDERWYFDAEKGGWIASAIVRGNAPGSSALRPISTTPNPDPGNPLPPSPTAALPGKQREYRIRPGDTLSAIAERELGNAGRWREITKANGNSFTEVEARNLAIGLSVYLPVVFRVEKKTVTPQDSKPKAEPMSVILPPIFINPPLIISGSSYSRDLAVQYANQYASQPNSDFHYFTYNKKLSKDWWATIWSGSLKYKEEDLESAGGDCTNFVTQCLIQGGIISLDQATEGWHNGKRVLKNTFTAVDNLLGYLDRERLSSQESVWGLSNAEKTAAIRQFLKPGDIISYEFTDPSTRGDHLSLFIGYDQKGEPQGANHTSDGVRPIKLDSVEKLISVSSRNLGNSVTFV
jgi:murein DD-endopeptidase MepM/ murein hydrolase activator NlpD